MFTHRCATRKLRNSKRPRDDRSDIPEPFGLGIEGKKHLRISALGKSKTTSNVCMYNYVYIYIQLYYIYIQLYGIHTVYYMSGGFYLFCGPK